MSRRQPRIATGRPRSGHRLMIYCDDATVPWWGYWCRDCPYERAPYTQSKAAAETSASKHSTATQPRELIGS